MLFRWLPQAWSKAGIKPLRDIAAESRSTASAICSYFFVAASGFGLAQAQSFEQLHFPSLSHLQLLWAHSEQVMGSPLVDATCVA